MFSGVPKASVISVRICFFLQLWSISVQNSPTIKGRGVAIELSVSDAGLLGVSQMRFDDGEFRAFIDKPRLNLFIYLEYLIAVFSQFLLAFPHWEEGRAVKEYAIKHHGNMAESKRLLYAGLLGADFMAKDQNTPAKAIVHKFKPRRGLKLDQGPLRATVDNYIAEKLKDMLTSDPKVGFMDITLPHLMDIFRDIIMSELQILRKGKQTSR